MTLPSLLIGTWCTYEVGEPPTKEEYEKAYKIATEGESRIYILNELI